MSLPIGAASRWTTADVSDFVLRVLPLYGTRGKLESLGPATVFLRMGLTAVQSQGIEFGRLLADCAVKQEGGAESADVEESPTMAQRVQKWMNLALKVLEEEVEPLLGLLRTCARNGSLARFVSGMVSRSSNETARATWQVYLEHLPGGGKVAIEETVESDDNDSALSDLFGSLKTAWERWPSLNAAAWIPFLSDLRHHYDLCEKAICWPGDAQHDSSSPVHAMAHAMAGTLPIPMRYGVLRYATPSAESVRHSLFGFPRATLPDRTTWGLAQFHCILLALPFTRPPVPAPVFMLPIWPQSHEPIPQDQLKGVPKIYARGAAFASARNGPSGEGRYGHAYPMIRAPKLPQCIAMLALNASILGDKQRFVLASFLAQCAPPECVTLQQALAWAQELAQQVELLPRARTLMSQRASVADVNKEGERMDYMEATFTRDRGDAKIFACSRIINSPIEGRADVYDRVICPHHSGQVGDIEDLAKQACAVHCGVAPADAAAARRKHHSMATLWANAGQL